MIRDTFGLWQMLLSITTLTSIISSFRGLVQAGISSNSRCFLFFIRILMSNFLESHSNRRCTTGKNMFPWHSNHQRLLRTRCLICFWFFRTKNLTRGFSVLSKVIFLKFGKCDLRFRWVFLTHEHDYKKSRKLKTPVGFLDFRPLRWWIRL